MEPDARAPECCVEPGSELITNVRFFQETWLYNWQTKELESPAVLMAVSHTLKDLHDAFDSLVQVTKLINGMPKDLCGPALKDACALVDSATKRKKEIDKELELKINALRLYWFPETVAQLKLGAYKTVRQPPHPLLVSEDELGGAGNSDGGPTCAVCYMSYSDPDVIPVILIQRCKLNPLLAKCCTLECCHCTLPPLCLGKSNGRFKRHNVVTRKRPVTTDHSNMRFSRLRTRPRAEKLHS